MLYGHVKVKRPHGCCVRTVCRLIMQYSSVLPTMWELNKRGKEISVRTTEDGEALNTPRLNIE